MGFTGRREDKKIIDFFFLSSRLPVQFLCVLRALCVLCVLSGLSGCGRRAPNATPDGAVRELVERLRRVQGDPADAKAAFELLSKRTQSNLATRAQRYSA